MFNFNGNYGYRNPMYNPMFGNTSMQGLFGGANIGNISVNVNIDNGNNFIRNKALEHLSNKLLEDEMERLSHYNDTILAIENNSNNNDNVVIVDYPSCPPPRIENDKEIDAVFTTIEEREKPLIDILQGYDIVNTTKDIQRNDRCKIITNFFLMQPDIPHVCVVVLSETNESTVSHVIKTAKQLSNDKEITFITETVDDDCVESTKSFDKFSLFSRSMITTKKLIQKTIEII